MCNADTTVEKKDEQAGGVHGFGVQHHCKHWFQLVDWTAKAQQKATYRPFHDTISHGNSHGQ
jgi:hypothetical protein